MSLFLSINQATKFGDAFKEAFAESFDQLRPVVTTQGSNDEFFGPPQVSSVMVTIDHPIVFDIEAKSGNKYRFGVSPCVHGIVDNDQVDVSIFCQVRSELLEGTDDLEAMGGSQKLLLDLLQEQGSDLTSLSSPIIHMGLNDYDKAKESIQGYLDEFAAMVLSDYLIDIIN